MRLRKTITTIVATAILLAGWQLFAVIANQPELIPSLPRLVRTLCEWLVSGSSISRSERLYSGSLRHVDLIRLCDRDGRVIRPF